jgi:hypothetical protein
MGIQIGLSTISKIFTQTPFAAVEPTVSGSVVGLLSGSYSNGSSWPSTTGSNDTVIGAPLASGSNGRWQFNGSDEYIIISSSQLSSFNQAEYANQEFTFLFYGTIGSLSTRRALFGSGGGGYNNGGDAIMRTDTTPPAGTFHLDLRGLAGATNRFTVTGTSGSLINIAVAQSSSGEQYLYQDGVLVATSGSLGFVGYAPFTTSSNNVGAFIGYNGNVDASTYNGQLGAAFLYNRVLSATEISQSAYSFYSGSAGGSLITPITSVFLGTDKVFPAFTPTSMSVMTLVVGGGGEGGTGTGGGAGAGGVVYSSSISLLTGIYTVTVGAGGKVMGATTYSNAATTASGGSGETSSFSSGSVNVLAYGGGGGASYGGGTAAITALAKSGGSGGGGSDWNYGTRNLRVGGAGTVGMGFPGGTSPGNANGSGAGGGGASQTGSATQVTGRGAPGGSGSAYTIRDGNSVFYGGGGGAGAYNTTPGGLATAGGGQGGNASGGAGFSGSANTGGGGGGGNRNVDGTINGAGGAGGSGIIVIAYLTSSAVGLSVSGGIEQTYTSSSLVYKSHTFLSSSNFVIS